jgi:hypothetical protein
MNNLQELLNKTLTAKQTIGILSFIGAFVFITAFAFNTTAVQNSGVANVTSAVNQAKDGELAQSVTTPSKYVILISVDGMGAEYVKTFTNSTTNNLTTIKRLMNEGVSTMNARTDKDYTITLPNHVSMVTSRGVVGTAGHNWTVNVDPAVGQTLATNKGSYVASMFDVAHDNGLRTGMWAGKTKFMLFRDSYNSTNGAADTTGINNGRDKIDHEFFDEDIPMDSITTDFINQMNANPYNLSFVHYPDQTFKDMQLVGQLIQIVNTLLH